jgi:FAD/FMN-containing dehydrogenase
LFIIDYSIFLEADSDIVVQSGARWEDINDTLKEKGIPLFFPVTASRKNLIAMLIVISA